MYSKKIILVLLLVSIILSTFLKDIVNAGVLETAQEFATYEWTATKENVEHEVYTHFGVKPYFKTGEKVTGVAYAWWRCDSVSEFRTGINVFFLTLFDRKIITLNVNS